MTFIPTPNAARVSIVASYFSRPIVNTLWFTQAVAFSSSDLSGLCTLVMESWQDHVMHLLNTNYHLETLTAWAQDSDSAPVVTINATGQTSGYDQSASVLSANAAVCITLHTAHRGRSGRGRIYLGGLGASVMENGNSITAAWKALADGYFENLLSDLDGGAWTWVVVSHYTGKAARQAGLAQPITAVQVRPRLDSQRRRLG